MLPHGTVILILLACLFALTSGIHIKEETSGVRHGANENGNHLQSYDGTTEYSGVAKLDQTSIFCFALVCPWEETLDLLLEQLSGCSSHLLFSNFSDPGRGIIRLFDDMKITKVFGFANNTLKFAKAWDYIARSIDKPFDWYVKVDPDTFFRPRMLLPILSSFDPSHVMAVGMGGRSHGPLEVVSKGAVHGPKPFFKDPLSVIQSYKGTFKASVWIEDAWLDEALKSVGGYVADAPEKDGCIVFAISYCNHEKFRSACSDKSSAIFQSGLCFDDHGFGAYIADISKSLEKKFTPRKKDKEDCISTDIAALHAVKDRSTYERLQRVDARML